MGEQSYLRDGWMDGPWISIHLYHTFLDDSQNYQPQGAVAYLMIYEPLAFSLVR